MYTDLKMNPSFKFRLNLFFLKYAQIFRYKMLLNPHIFLNSKNLKVKNFSIKVSNFYWFFFLTFFVSSIILAIFFFNL